MQRPGLVRLCLRISFVFTLSFVLPITLPAAVSATSVAAMSPSDRSPSVGRFLDAGGGLDLAAVVASGIDGTVDLSGHDFWLVDGGLVSEGRHRGAEAECIGQSAGGSNDQWCPGFGQPPSENGTDGPVYALAVYKGDVIAAGDFIEADGVIVNHIARWTGTQWGAMGAGLDGPVYALVATESDLYAGGAFVTSGGTGVVPNVGQWDGDSWVGLGSGPGGTVRCLGFNGNRLVAGGEFPGFISQYTPLERQGGGVAGDLGSGSVQRGGLWLALPPTSGPVRALASFQGDLIAGGDFLTAGGVNVNYVARYDGANWHGLGASPAGLDAPVLSLVVGNDELYVGGSFTERADLSQQLERVAKWNGAAWSPLANGLAGTVRSLAFFGGRIHAGGDFVFDGDGLVELNHIAGFDGSGWQALGSGIAPAGASSVRAMVPKGINARLYVGGNFNTTGNKEALQFGLWSNPLVTGEVVDAFNTRPISKADVTVGGCSTTTDLDGVYEIGVSPGAAQTLDVSHAGYIGQDTVVPALTGCIEHTEDFALETNTVLLVHGWPSSSATWGPDDELDFIQTLHDLGGAGRYRIETIDLIPSFLKRFGGQGRIRRQAQVLEEYLSDLRNEGVMSVSVVAHSAGGLVTRYVINEYDGFAVNKLIMLGSPNHGTEFSRVVRTALHLFYAWLFGPSLASVALAEATFPAALRDMDPGSNLLDQLNYDDQQDSRNNWKCREHNDETTLGSSVEYVTFAADSQDPGCQGRVLRRTVGRLVQAFSRCHNDHLVPVASVPLAVNTEPSNVHNWTDDQCFTYSTHRGETCYNMTEDIAVAAAVENVLRGGRRGHVQLAEARAPFPGGRLAQARGSRSLSHDFGGHVSGHRSGWRI